MPLDFLEKLKEKCANSISFLQQAAFLDVQVSSWKELKVLGQVEVEFKINVHDFKDIFLILPSRNSMVLGNHFLKNYSIEISPSDTLLKLPEVAYQLTEIECRKKVKKKLPKTRQPVCLLQKVVIK